MCPCDKYNPDFLKNPLKFPQNCQNRSEQPYPRTDIYITSKVDHTKIQNGSHEFPY